MQAKKSNGGSGGIAPFILKFGSIRRCVDRFSVRSHGSSAQSLRYPADRRPVETQTRPWTLWGKGQNFASSRDWTTPSFVQPVALSLFTRPSVRLTVQRKMWPIFTKCGVTVSLKGPPPHQSHTFRYPAVTVRSNKTAVSKTCLRSTEFHSNKQSVRKKTKQRWQWSGVHTFSKNQGATPNF